MSKKERPNFDAKCQDSSGEIYENARNSTFCRARIERRARTFGNVQEREGDKRGTRARLSRLSPDLSPVTEAERHVLAQVDAIETATGVSPDICCLEVDGLLISDAPMILVELAAKRLVDLRVTTNAHMFASVTAAGRRLAHGEDLRCDHEISRVDYVARELRAQQEELVAKHERLVEQAVAAGWVAP